MKRTIQLLLSIIGLLVAFAPLHGASKSKRKPAKKAPMQQLNIDMSSIVDTSLHNFTRLFGTLALQKEYTPEEITAATNFVKRHFYLIAHDVSASEEFFTAVRTNISTNNILRISKSSDELITCLRNAFTFTLSADGMSAEEQAKLAASLRAPRIILPSKAVPKDKAQIAKEAMAELARLKQERAITFAKGYCMLRGIVQAQHLQLYENNPKGALAKLVSTRILVRTIDTAFGKK